MTSSRLFFGALVVLVSLSTLPWQATRAQQLPLPDLGSLQGQDEVWVPVGPRGIAIPNNDVISGQVNAIAVHPLDANRLFIGASEGGVWKTTDGGASWAPISDFQLVRVVSNQRRGTMSIGALAIDPTRPDTIYAGTGDPNVACCFAGPGLGVFRSIDGGLSWTATGANPGRAGCENNAIGQAVVYRVIVRPGTPTRVFAATSLGVFRYAEDGGDCWIRLVNGIPTGRAVTDLVVDPFKDVLYAGVSGLGIYRSQDPDGGAWTMLVKGLPTTGLGRIALAFAGRTGIGISGPGRRLYAGFDTQTDGRQMYRLFHTSDGGDAWTELPSPPNDGQLGFNNVLAVGLYSPDDVYVGQIGLWRASDGGRSGGLNDYKANPAVTDQSWTSLSCCLPHPNPHRKGLDLHADVHEVVFAPYGSFTPTPSETQIVYVATDGGVTRGAINFEGVVSWVSLTQGLAIAQCGSFGLHPNDRFESACGVWHNGNALVNAASGTSALVGFGDGFAASIDAAAQTTIYINCNAGFGGDICRAVRTGSGFSEQRIWSSSISTRHWSDPYRPGHLLMLQGGLLFRTTAGNTASENDLLNGPNAWVLIEPPGKTGLTTTMAFRSWVLEEQPVYYLGTSTGQVWRGSPEAGWSKVCDCGRSVVSLGPDLFRNEILYAVFAGTTRPGRIKRIVRSGGAWSAEDIDATFPGSQQVKLITSIAPKPVVPFLKEIVVYAGTDQGVQRGQLGASGWSWTRAAGVPDVVVTELRAHQSARFFDLTGLVRASTYGRGIYELRRSSGPVIAQGRLVTVEAIRVVEDGAPRNLSVSIQANTPRARGTRETPFEIGPHPDGDVSLEAPAEVRDGDAVLTFAGWALGDGRHERSRRVTVTTDTAAKLVAYYELKERLPPAKAVPLRLSVRGTAREVCDDAVSHELTLSWEATGGRPPVSVRAVLTFPDRTTDLQDMRPAPGGSRQVPLNFRGGGRLLVELFATDAERARSTAKTEVVLTPCRPGKQAARR